MKGYKTWREATKGGTEIRYLLLLWNHVDLLHVRKAATESLFPLLFVLLSWRPTITPAGECEAEWLHRPKVNTRACWKPQDLKTSCSVFTGEKTEFAWSHDGGLTQCVSHITSVDLDTQLLHRSGQETTQRRQARNLLPGLKYLMPDGWNFVLKSPKWKCMELGKKHFFN